MNPADYAGFFDPELWTELRGIIVPVVHPIFEEGFLLGGELGAMQRPAPEREGSVLELGLRAEPDRAGNLRPNIQTGETINLYDAGALAEAASGAVGRYTDEWWQTFEEATKKTARRIIDHAASAGLTNDEVTRQMARLFGAERAQRIAVSALTDLMGVGAQETYRLAGYEFWQWRTVRDSRVDPICRGRAGKRYRMSVTFRKAHINCRCWPVPYGKPNPALIHPEVFAA